MRLEIEISIDGEVDREAVRINVTRALMRQEANVGLSGDADEGTATVQTVRIIEP